MLVRDCTRLPFFIQRQRNEPCSCPVSHRVWSDRRYFIDSYFSSQLSRKLGARQFGSFPALKRIGTNAPRLMIFSHGKAQPSVHVEHTKLFSEQPVDIQIPTPTKSAVIPDNHGDYVVTMEKILNLRKGDSGY